MMKNLNNWERVWLVFTAALAVWCLLYLPARAFNQSARASDGYRAGMQADFSSGNCDAYINGPLEKLTEPSYFAEGGTCWYIFKTRTTYKIESTPFTQSDARNHALWEQFKSISGVLFTGLLVLIACSGLLYLAGAAVAQIRRSLVRNPRGRR